MTSTISSNLDDDTGAVIQSWHITVFCVILSKAEIFKIMDWIVSISDQCLRPESTESNRELIHELRYGWLWWSKRWFSLRHVCWRKASVGVKDWGSALSLGDIHVKVECQWIRCCMWRPMCFIFPLVKCVIDYNFHWLCSIEIFHSVGLKLAHQTGCPHYSGHI